MKRVYLLCLFQCLATTFLLSQSNPISAINPNPGTDAKSQSKIRESYGKLPLAFEANRGQTDAQVKFLSRTKAYTLFLTADEAILTLPSRQPKNASAKNSTAPASLRMKLRHANPATKIAGADELPGTSNYFIGNDPTKWHTSVPTYAKVKYEQIYSGIDLVYYGNQRQLEYDFIVSPGADPKRIAFDITGASRIRQNAQGDLVLKMQAGSKGKSEEEIRWHKPVVYQEKDGARHQIATHYTITDRNRVGFELAKYDPSRPLYIDPLIYSTYLSGSGSDAGQGVAVDSAGNAYVTGYTASTDFPITRGAFQTTYGGNAYDVFVSKINPGGTAFIYSTYLGGSSYDRGYGIAVDSTGNAFVAGDTGSSDFPVTAGAFQSELNGLDDGFVTEINSTGTTLIYSTYLGGVGGATESSIAVDGSDNAYVTGLAGAEFPTTHGAFQTTCTDGNACAVVTKLNTTGTALVYSTFLGGSLGATGAGIALDEQGNAYVTGYTESIDFPVTAGAFQTSCDDCTSFDAFVTKINPTGSGLVYSSYLGGSTGNFGFGIAVDGLDNAYVTGLTYSIDFPTTPGSYQPVCPSKDCPGGEAFVSKVNPAGSALLYSTYLGGTGDELGGGTLSNGIALDNSGSSYVTGYTLSKEFPTTVGAFQTVCKGCGAKGSGGVAFVTKFNPAGSTLDYSTYLGGSAGKGNGAGPQAGAGIVVGSEGYAYIVGTTNSPHFPLKNPLQSEYAGNNDAFVSKIDLRLPTTTILSSSPNPSTYGQSVTLTASITSAAGVPTNGETVSFVKGTTVIGTGTLTSGTATFTTSSLKAGTTTIKAVYPGDSNFAASTSKPIKQVVDKAEN
jgi:hypothetical protein